MIDIIVNILSLDDYYGVSENIDIAKGYNKLPLSFSEGIEATKRKRAWRKK